MKKLVFLIVALACMFVLSPFANAAVLTFDGLAGEVESPYTESGFALTAEDDNDFYAVVEDDAEYGYYYSGSGALMNDYTTATTLTSTDGSLFNLESIDLSEAFTGNLLYAVTVTFTAEYADGSTYNEDLTTDGVSGFETVTFDSEFTNLSSASFIAYDSEGYTDYFQFDNVTASAVPIPSAILLLASGLTALVATRGRKQ